MEEKKLKVITYNVDGLPETLDLNDLPWILRPIAWVYRLFKGTTVITVNDNSNVAECMLKISSYLHSSDADIIGIQESFNYREELLSSLDGYTSGKYTGGFDLSKIFSSTEWLSCFPLPRFKTDGLCGLFKSDRIHMNTEDIVWWKKSYGYFTHANDKLVHKGFRFYPVTIDNLYDLDLYIVHMDADFYDDVQCPDVSGDIAARKAQLNQLTQHILGRQESGIHNPVLIMGDTNSSDYYLWDVYNIVEELLYPISKIQTMHIAEATPNEKYKVDRIFYINNDDASWNLVLDTVSFDESTNGYSDHPPLQANFSLVYKY